VTTGQPVARVGHTGNTTEPHLHLHAVRPDGPVPTPDSLAGAPPVPLTLNGRFLLRNDRLSTAS
jgi:murein DD-endopeptidase MepM/ murein hydrolase activator NlpD